MLLQNLPEDIIIYIYKIYHKTYLFPELINYYKDPCKRRFDINEFDDLFECKDTMKQVYSMYISIHDMNLWNKVYHDNDINVDLDIIYKILLHSQIKNKGHSSYSILNCYKHMQYLKINGWDSYVQKMRKIRFINLFERLIHNNL